MWEPDRPGLVSQLSSDSINQLEVTFLSFHLSLSTWEEVPPCRVSGSAEG